MFNFLHDLLSGIDYHTKKKGYVNRSSIVFIVHSIEVTVLSFALSVQVWFSSTIWWIQSIHLYLWATHSIRTWVNVFGRERLTRFQVREKELGSIHLHLLAVMFGSFDFFKKWSLVSDSIVRCIVLFKIRRRYTEFKNCYRYVYRNQSYQSSYS